MVIMPNILITGGAGFIGQHLVKRLYKMEDYNNIIIIDDFSNASKEFIDWIHAKSNKISFYREDIRNADSISNILKYERTRPDTCIHLAAKTSVHDSITKPNETTDINVKGTLNVLDACSSNGVKSFVFASSAAVYGEPKQLPVSENHILEPLSPYGKSKVAGESLVSLFATSKKIQNAISLRFFNVYGEGQNHEYAGVITRFAERLSNRLPPIIYGDGKNTRDFVSVDDAVNAILLAMSSADKIKLAILNIGTGIPISINALATKMLRICKLDLQPIYYKPREGDIRNSYADTAKSKTTLKFIAMQKFDLGLTQILKDKLYLQK